MACIALLFGLALFAYRRPRGITTAVPLAMMAVGAALLALTAIQFRAVFASLEHVSPADKATILAAMISEALSVVSVGNWLALLLFAAAFVVDHRLRARGRMRPAVAGVAPPDASCVAHVSERATHICSRCGAFMCSACAAADGARCAACLTRSPAR